MLTISNHKPVWYVTSDSRLDLGHRSQYFHVMPSLTLAHHFVQEIVGPRGPVTAAHTAACATETLVHGPQTSGLYRLIDMPSICN